MAVEFALVDISPVLYQDLLGHDLSPALKSEILKSLFGCKLSAADFEDYPGLWKGYFEFYSEQCLAVLHASIHECPVKSHRDLVEVVRFLRQPGTTRAAAKDHLRKQLPMPAPSGSEDLLSNIIDLAARIGLMVFIGSFHFDAAEQRTLAWQGVEEDDLQGLLKKAFTTQQLPAQNVKLEKLFLARNIERIGGIRIDWTNNLADHLRMHEDDTMVSIFHHASFLKLHRESPLFPRDVDGNSLIEETLRTLSIIFPPHDKQTLGWFKKQPKSLCLDIETTRCKHLKAEDRQIGKFKYWQDRLSILKQVFDEAEPKTVKQWWWDRRKPVQWYNFWFAVALVVGLTAFFGVIQSIEGALQVYKAYYPS